MVGVQQAVQHLVVPLGPPMAHKVKDGPIHWAVQRGDHATTERLLDMQVGHHQEPLITHIRHIQSARGLRPRRVRAMHMCRGSRDEVWWGAPGVPPPSQSARDACSTDAD